MRVALTPNRVRTSPNQALQRTAPAVTPGASALDVRLWAGRAAVRFTRGHPARQPSAVAELGVVRRLALSRNQVMIKCPKCSSVFREPASHCEFCGTALGSEPNAPKLFDARPGIFAIFLILILGGGPLLLGILLMPFQCSRQTNQVQSEQSKSTGSAAVSELESRKIKLEELQTDH